MNSMGVFYIQMMAVVAGILLGVSGYCVAESMRQSIIHLRCNSSFIANDFDTFASLIVAASVCGCIGGILVGEIIEKTKTYYSSITKGI